jgi:hypothetical protein
MTLEIDYTMVYFVSDDGLGHLPLHQDKEAAFRAAWGSGVAAYVFHRLA